MAETTIEWANYSFNPWRGCSKVSRGCARCYAEKHESRFGKVKWGPSGTRVVTSEANWRKPVKWNREAEESGIRKRVFCASLADVFEDWKGPMHDHNGNVLTIGDGTESGERDDVSMDYIRHRLFKLIDATPNLDWLLLTKRPENVVRMWPAYFPGGYIAEAGSMNEEGPRPNVWIGTSVENQEQAEKRIPELLKCHDLASVLFLSCEPMVGPVNLESVRGQHGWQIDALNGYYTTEVQCGPDSFEQGQCEQGPSIGWVIAGGESGPGARPMNANWVRSLRDQCNGAGVPFHFKQWGEWCPETQLPGDVSEKGCAVDDSFVTLTADGKDYHGDYQYRIGTKKAGRKLDGVTHDGFPNATLSRTDSAT